MNTQENAQKRVEELLEFLDNVDFIEKLIVEIEKPEKRPKLPGEEVMGDSKGEDG